MEAPRGRFWALSQISDEDEDCGEVSDPPSAVTTSDRGSEYWRSSAPETCSLRVSTLSAVRRREEKRRGQRQAAMALHPGEFSDRFIRPLLTNVCRSPERRTKILPVMEPSTFLLDSFDAAEWMIVQRRKRRTRCVFHPRFLTPRGLPRRLRRGSPPLRRMPFPDQRHDFKYSLTVNSLGREGRASADQIGRAHV